MNDKHGNKAGTVGTKKSDPPPEFNQGLPSEIETKIDVSEFLKSLVDHTATQVNGLREFVVKSDQAADARTDDIVDEIADVKKSLQNIGIVLKAVCERIGIVENKPATVAKSDTAAQGKPTERQFENTVKSGSEAPVDGDGGDGGGTGHQNQNATGFYKSLAGKSPMEMKKCISTALCDLVKKGELAETEVINFETYSHISPEADVKLRSMLN
jgi:hypothetical protein